MNEFWNSVVTLGMGIIGIAFLAVLVSKQADTSNVIGTAGKAFSGALSAAEAPVTGAASAYANPTLPVSFPQFSM
jgi:hypothetical protein